MLVEDKSGRLVRKLWMKYMTESLLDSFKSDSAGMPNTADVRTKELGDRLSIGNVFNIPEAMLLNHERHIEVIEGYGGVSARCRNRYHEVYENSFSKQRNPAHESARINLGGPEVRRMK